MWFTLQAPDNILGLDIEPQAVEHFGARGLNKRLGSIYDIRSTQRHSLACFAAFSSSIFMTFSVRYRRSDACSNRAASATCSSPRPTRAELRDASRESDDARALAGRLAWTERRHDMPAVRFASDVVVLSSDDEGSPVNLIEAPTAGPPVVSARVGGAASVIGHGETGFVVLPDDQDAFVADLRRLLASAPLAASLGRAGRPSFVALLGLDRLVADCSRLFGGER